MIAFRLDDFKDQPLREAGVQLGIESASTMPKDDLLREIKKCVSPNSPIVFVPLGGNAGSHDSWSRWISGIALVVSLAAAAATWFGVISAINRNTAEHEEKTKETWQALQVYDILDRAISGKDWGGLTFEEIKTRYREEAAAEPDVKLGKEDLQPKALKRIVVGMIESGLVGRTIEDRYIIQRYVVNSKENVLRSLSETTSNRQILRFLATESGKYTVDQLGTKLIADKKLDGEEFEVSMNALEVARLIVIDADGKVSSAVRHKKAK